MPFVSRHTNPASHILTNSSVLYSEKKAGQPCHFKPLLPQLYSELNKDASQNGVGVKTNTGWDTHPQNSLLCSLSKILQQMEMMLCIVFNM